MVGRLSRKKSELLSKEKDVKYLYVVDYATTIRDYSVAFQVLGLELEYIDIYHSHGFYFNVNFLCGFLSGGSNFTHMKKFKV